MCTAQTPALSTSDATLMLNNTDATVSCYVSTCNPAGEVAPLVSHSPTQWGALQARIPVVSQSSSMIDTAATNCCGTQTAPAAVKECDEVQSAQAELTQRARDAPDESRRRTKELMDKYIELVDRSHASLHPLAHCGAITS